jgi:hypothetical protein
MFSQFLVLIGILVDLDACLQIYYSFSYGIRNGTLEYKRQYVVPFFLKVES